MMEHLERTLQAMGIPFDRNGNRVRQVISSLVFHRQGLVGYSLHSRCFPHVINIAVQTALAHLSRPAGNESSIEGVSNGTSSQETDEYTAALEGDPVATCRRLVNACRASGQRRADFRSVIVDGNAEGEFHSTLRAVQLLRDVETRWSSTYLMIDRVLELNEVCTQFFLLSLKPAVNMRLQAINVFLDKAKQRDIAYMTLTKADLQVLEDIRAFLQIPHTVQELLSAERTPTLSMVIPTYEKLISMLKDAEIAYPRIAHVIKESREKVDEYLMLSRRTRIYMLAMSIYLLLLLQTSRH